MLAYGEVDVVADEFSTSHVFEGVFFPFIAGGCDGFVDVVDHGDCFDFGFG